MKTVISKLRVSAPIAGIDVQLAHDVAAIFGQGLKQKRW
jgi:hypothetical protein